MYDLLIRHGHIIDGMGSAPYAADVRVDVTAGRVVTG
jgi:N-acyl-D-aspartate/D-glutamate deacylase